LLNKGRISISPRTRSKATVQASRMAGHSYWRMALIITACLSFLVVCVINGLAGAGNTVLANDNLRVMIAVTVSVIAGLLGLVWFRRRNKPGIESTQQPDSERTYRKAGEEASISAQGDSLTCVRHALAKSVIMIAHNSIPQMDFKQAEAISAIQNLDVAKHPNAEHVITFNNQEILMQDYISQQLYFVNMQVRVCDIHDYSPDHHGYILQYNAREGPHAVYVQYQESGNWVCLNSWGDYDPEPMVNVQQAGNALFEVYITLRSSS